MSASLLSLLPSLRLGFGRRLPSILQTEAAECGLACVAMVAGYHGYETDLRQLRQQAGVSQRGSTMASVIDIAAALGFATRAVRIELDELPFMATPCILHWEMNHFVVLNKVKTWPDGRLASIVIHDPAKGVRQIDADQLSRSFTGIALEMVPSSSFEPKKEKQTIKFSQLLGRVVGLRSGLLQIIGLAFALELFALVAPFFMQLVVDGAILSADRDLLSMLALGFGLLMLIQTAIAMFRSWAVIYLGTHLGLQWVGNVFRHLVRLPMHFFEKRHLGDVTSRFNAINIIQHTLTNSFAEAIIDGVLAITVLVMMFVYSASLTVVVLLAIGAYLLLRVSMYGAFRRASEEQITLQAVEQSLFIETLRGIQAIKLFNHEESRRGRWLNAMAAATNRKVATQKMTLGFTTVHTLFAGIENIVIVLLGAQLVMNNVFSVGMLVAFMAYKAIFTGRIYSLIDKVLELKMLSLQGERLADIVLTPQEGALSGAHAQSFQSAPADLTIEVRNLSFRYSDIEPWVVNDVSLTIPPGESLALIGPSGCGKTTFLKLLLGLLEPVRGQILIGGIPLSQLGARNYRALIGAVMQDDSLLAGSIFDNISFFDHQPDAQRVHECARQSAIAGEIEKMPMQYQTLIGDMGTSLSGGQKQRLLLARALYKQPKILFLDEATSHLDVGRESEINHTITGLSLTRVIVAHRPETIRSANRTVELQNGQIVRDLRRADSQHEQTA